jgi:hypothetical protein
MFLFRGCDHKRNAPIGLKVVGEAVAYGKELPFAVVNELRLCKDCGVVFVPIEEIDTLVPKG